MTYIEWLQIVAYVLVILAYTPVIIGRFVRKYRKTKPSPIALQKARPRLKVPFVMPYLFAQEVIVIGISGLILNFLGLAVSMNVRSILYLDMTGTAVTALLLGPWWGALIGTLSNSLLYWFVFPEQSAYLAVLPWMLVNMAGGLLWGFMGRTEWFRKYVQSAEVLNTAHLYYLAKFGVLAACIMSMVGAGVQAVLGGNANVSFDPSLSTAMGRLVTALQQSLLSPLQGIFGMRGGEALSWGIPIWLQNWIRFIPDKTISAAMALAIIRYGFPVFKRELISDDKMLKPPSDNWTGPLLLGLVYLPSFVYFIHKYHNFRPLWVSPLVIACFGALVLLWRGPSLSEVAQARGQRLDTYLRVFAGMTRGATIRLRDNYGLWFGTSVASIFFLLALPISGLSISDFYRIALNFTFVVFGFFFAMQLTFIVTAQNLGIERLTDKPIHPPSSEEPIAAPPEQKP